jgi:hypothetical protein
MLASGPVLGTSASGGSGLPADQAAPAPPEPATAQIAFPRGSIWAAQVGRVRPDEFVLLVAGMPFDVAGAPPSGEGGTLMVRVVDDGTPPLFEMLAREMPHAQNAALRSLLAHLLRRALATEGRSAGANTRLDAASSSAGAIATALRQGVHDQLARPTPDLAHYLETGLVRLDLRLDSGHGPTHCRVEVHDAQDDPERQEDTVTATVFVDLPATGSVEARLTLSAGRLRVHFVVESDDVRERLLDCAGELISALSSAGFHGVDLAAQADAARLARDRATDEVPRESRRAGGLLDIRA